jgi:hypothetical protein
VPVGRGVVLRHLRLRADREAAGEDVEVVNRRLKVHQPLARLVVAAVQLLARLDPGDADPHAAVERLHVQGVTDLLGDRVAVLERGLVAQVGTPDDVYRRPVDRFVAAFVGSPAMNFLPAEAAARFGLGGDGEIGVRPEHVRLEEGEVEGEVVIVEPAGSEAFVHLDAAGARLVARVVPEELPEVGQRVPVGIRPGDVHRFDAEGKRVE